MMKTKKVSKKIYGNPTSDHLKTMESDSPMIGIDASNIRIRVPPEIKSREEKSEVRSLLKSLESSENNQEFIKLADEDIVNLFMSFCQENGLYFDKEYYKNLSSQLRKLILKLKYRFNRPRPRQTYDSINIKDYKSSKTPSYPSGHAIQSHTIANMLSKSYPNFDKSLKILADRISFARVQQGVHYPSDIIAGEEVANIIDPYISNPNRIGAKKMIENNFRSIIRDFLHESYKDSPTKLRILDFDDTIAQTVERVRIETPDGPKMISSSEFASYDFLPGESLDRDLAFEEFKYVDIEKATPVPFISDLLRTFAGPSGTSKILILTARGQEVEEFVMDFLEKRLNIPNARERADFVGVANKDPMAKVKVLEDYISSFPSIEFVSFYDDSRKNVIAIRDFLNAKGIKSDTRQVVTSDSGDTRLIQPEQEPERLSERAMIKRFLRGIL